MVSPCFRYPSHQNCQAPQSLTDYFRWGAELSVSSDWLAIQNPLIGDVEFKDGKVTFIDTKKNTTSILRT